MEGDMNQHRKHLKTQFSMQFMDHRPEIKTIKKKVNERYKEFSAGTSMHGFTEVYNATTFIAKGFWILAIMVSVCFAIYQVCQATEQYVNQVSITYVQTAKIEEVIYPPMKICFPHWLQWVDIEKAEELNFTMNALLYGLRCFGMTVKQNQTDAAIGKDEFYNALKSNDFPSPNQFLDSIIKSVDRFIPTISSFKEDVMSVVAGSELFDNIEKEGSKVCFSSNSETLKSFLELNSNNSHKSNILSFKLNIRDYYRSKYISDEDYAWYITKWMSFFKMDYKLIGKNPFATLEFTEEELDQYTRIPFPVELYINSFGNTFTTSFIEVVPQVDKYMLTVKPSVNRWMNSLSIPCVEGQSHNTRNTTCNDECMDEFLGQANWNIKNRFRGDRFKCYDDMNNNKLFIHSITSKNIVPVPVRNISDEYYAKLSSQTVYCAKMCLPGCEQWRYDVSVATSSIYPAMYAVARKVSTTIEIVYPADGEILIVTEVDKQSWDNFVGSIGGIIGVWTGASILSIIQLIYLCCWYKSGSAEVNHQTVN